MAPLDPSPILPTRSRLSAVFAGIRQRWFLALLTASFLGTNAALLLWSLNPIRHHGEVRLRVSPPSDAAAVDFLRDQAAVVKSPQVAQAAAADPYVQALATTRGWSDPAKQVLDSLSVETLPEKYQLHIRSTIEPFNEPLTLARTTAKAYLRMREKQRQEHRTALTEALAAADREPVKEPPPPAPVEPPPAPIVVTDPRLPDVEKALLQIRTEIQHARAELVTEEAKSKALALGSVSADVLAEAMLNDPIIQKTQKDLIEAETVVKQYLRIAAQGEKEPSLRPFIERRDSLRAEIAVRQKQIESVLKEQSREKSMAGAAARLKPYQERVAALERQEQLLDTEVRGLRAATKIIVPTPSPAPVPIVQARPGLDATTRAKMLAEIHDLEPTKGEPTWFAWIDESVAVDAASQRRQLLLTSLGGAGGFLLGLLFIGFAESRSQRVRSARDVSHGLSLPVLATPPGLTATLSALTSGPQSAVIDNLRSILLERVPDGPCVIVVSGPSDSGKRETAAHVAASLARSWLKTVLVDGDFDAPGLAALFGKAKAPGFAEVLRNEAELMDAIQPTALPRLWIVPAGDVGADARQALARGEAARFFDGLRDQYDCVVVEAPSADVSPEAALIAQHGDIVIVAARAGVSTMPAVHAARQRLAPVGNRLAGAVVLDATDAADTVPAAKDAELATVA